MQKERVEDYENDATIPNEEQLIRRVPPERMVFDKNQNRYRASSQVFRNPFLSIFLESRLRLGGMTAQDTLVDYDGYSAVVLTAGYVREEGQKVVHEPNDEPPPHRCDPAHGLVVGNKSSGKGERFARRAVLVVAGDLTQATQ